MRIIQVHNFYQQPGGEDESFRAECALLEAHGHQVERFTAHNDAIDKMGKLTVAQAALWNNAAHHSLRRVIREFRPDVVHFQNTFPLISPAAYYAAKAEGVPVVQSVRNYRLLCPAATFYRRGQVCESCMGKAVPWPGVLHGCYRGDRAASAAVAAMLTLHRALGTWTRKVDLYIVLTEFARRKLIEGGFPADRFVVKPNFVAPDPGVGPGDAEYALFVGRLAPEKGIHTLTVGWLYQPPGRTLKIVGDGPLAKVAAAAEEHYRGVEWLEYRPQPEVYELMRRAKIVIVPSEWYETFGRVVVEAFACGTPVIASNIGALAELVEHGRTGLLFTPGNADDLAAKVKWTWSHPDEMAAMRGEARAEYEAKYTAERNYTMLMEIYETAIAHARAS